MARSVLKYKFGVDPDSFPDTLVAPRGKVVLVQPQGPSSSAPTVWIEVEDLMIKNQTLYIYGTGHKVPDGLHHVGSAVCANGAFVWHVYTDYLSEAPVG